MRNRIILVLTIMVIVLLCSVSAQAVNMEWVTVADPGNPNDVHGDGYGAVDYVYRIGKCEVTNSQYCEFLKAVAGTDTYGLYNSSMATSAYGGITQSGSQGDYTYSVRAGRGNWPVNYVCWYDAIRFVNWLESGDTENGAYTIEDGNENFGTVSERNGLTGWHWVLPSEDEWYKAAYYKGGDVNAGYWDYATQSDTPSTEEANYNNVVGAPTDVNTYEFPSAYDTYDQTGNVWEWNETLIYGDCRGARGGSWGSPETSIPASYRHVEDDWINEDEVGGFRVAQVPEPSTLLLLGVGAVMLRRKRS